MNISMNTFLLQLFRALGNKTSYLNQSGSKFELWLGLDAYDDNDDAPCVSALKRYNDKDTVDKSRMDLALSHAGFTVHKVMAFSWDPYFTCTTIKSNNTLAKAILNDHGRPLVVDCRFHSPYNRSVVILGINLGALQQGFTVSYFYIYYASLHHVLFCTICKMPSFASQALNTLNTRSPKNSSMMLK
jgi:hypothetical protein